MTTATSKQVVVRYKLKPECVAEHEALIDGVFAQLGERAMKGIAYRVLKLDDGVSYLHYAEIEGEASLTKLDAFKAFVADIRSRCVEAPVTTEGKLLHRFA